MPPYLVKLAADVVRDWKEDIKGSFETAQRQFLHGQVIPMCAGWFGEINEDFDKTIKILAREAAAGIRHECVPPSEYQQESRSVPHNAAIL